MQALEELDYLAALDNEGNLSEMGIIMSEFPLEPQMAKTLLASCEYDCVSEVLIIAAMLTGSGVFSRRKFAHKFQWASCISALFCFFSPVLFPGSSRGPETGGHPLPREVPAPGGRPLYPHQRLQGLQTVSTGPTSVPRASPTNGLSGADSDLRFSSPLSDCDLAEWCQDLHLDLAALLTADALHVQLADTLKRIEMPVSAPAFGSRSNSLNIKKALLAGFFMQVRPAEWHHII